MKTLQFLSDWRICPLGVLISLIASVHHAEATGVTVITHGWIQTFESTFSGRPLWMENMVQAVTNAAYRQGLKSSWYHLHVTGNFVTGTQGTLSRVSTSSAFDSDEMVLTVDWSDIAEHTAPLSGQLFTTDDVAAWVSGSLVGTYSGIGINEPLASRPIHLIGHSRGGSVMLETARRLGLQGIWVDHLTTLDPHPLARPDFGVSPFGFHPGDPAAVLYSNVRFADNYWRQDVLSDYLFLGDFDFNGQSIPGCHELRLLEQVLDGVGYAAEHSDVHAWYHGTIGPPYEDSDGDKRITDDWYVYRDRSNEGFAFSRINSNGLENRKNSDFVRPAVSPGQAGAQWANIGDIQLPPYPQNNIPHGQTFNVTYKYQDRDSGMLVEWFADTDTNPLNGTGVSLPSQNLSSTGPSIASGNVVIPTASLSIGAQRHLLARITSFNDGLVRYEYGNSTFTVTPPDFFLSTVTPSQVTAGSGVTHLTLAGSGFSIADKIVLSSGGTSTQITPASITANRITVNFNFDSAVRTWEIKVRQFVAGFWFRDSEPLLFQVSSAPPSGLSVASVLPSTLPGKPLPQTQLLRIIGSGFTASSTLVFNDGMRNYDSEPPRLHFINSNEIDYDIKTDVTEADWTVKVINGAQQSNLGYFTVINPPPNTGSLSVNLSPPGAVSAGAQWRVDGGSYRNDGDTLTGLTLGSHSVSFKSVSGYTTPAEKSVSITSGVTATDSGTYSFIAPSTYTLTINPGGSQGYVAASPSGSDGDYTAGTVIQLTAYADFGYHFVGWGGALSGTANPAPLVMNGNKTVSANFAPGDDRMGTAVVTIQPPEAVQAGVKWGTYYDNYRESGTSWTTFPGSYFLVLHPVDGWLSPVGNNLVPVTIRASQTTNITITFDQDTTPGLLTVTLSPPGALTAGATWRMNGGLAQGSGVTVSLPPGANYTISFDSVPGWIAPANRSVQIQRSQTTVVNGNYAPPAGQPVIAAIHPSFGALAGGTALTIEGVNFTTPASVLIGGRLASNITVLSSSQIVCLTPSNSVYGTAPVVVETAGGIATNLNGFSYGIERGNGIELVTALGGRAHGVAVQGNYAYVGEGSSLIVVNISNPAVPSLVGRLAMPSMVMDIALLGTYAYVAVADAGLQVVDISNPSSPIIKGFYVTPGRASGLEILGGKAYVADGAGVEILDLSAPAFPTLVSSTSFNGAPDAVALNVTASPEKS